MTMTWVPSRLLIKSTILLFRLLFHVIVDILLGPFGVLKVRGESVCQVQSPHGTQEGLLDGQRGLGEQGVAQAQLEAVPGLLEPRSSL